MNYVKIKKNDEDTLEIIEWNSNKLLMLGSFLLYSITSIMGYNMFIGWLQGTAHQNSYAVVSFAYGLIRHKNGRIYVYDDHDPEEEYYLYFNTTADNMLKIIKDWCFIRFGCGEPESIEIIEENEKIKFILKVEGSDQPFIYPNDNTLDKI